MFFETRYQLRKIGWDVSAKCFDVIREIGISDFNLCDAHAGFLRRGLRKRNRGMEEQQDAKRYRLNQQIRCLLLKM